MGMISMHALLDIAISSSLLNSLHSQYHTSIQYCLAGLFRIPWQSHIKSSAVALTSLTILNSILVHAVDTVELHVLIMRHLLVHICWRVACVLLGFHAVYASSLTAVMQQRKLGTTVRSAVLRWVRRSSSPSSAHRNDLRFFYRAGRTMSVRSCVKQSPWYRDDFKNERSLL